MYEKMLEEARLQNIFIIENYKFKSDCKGLIHNDVIGLSNKIKTNKERSCVLAEELGHYYINTGDILNPKDLNNSKQEHMGRMYAYNRLIGLMGIVKAYEAGCQNKYEIAEYLNVTEEFLSDAISAYKSKYGIYTTIDNYTIYFIPSLGVMKLL